MVRARQVLIKLEAVEGSWSAPLTRESVASLKVKLNKVLANCHPGNSDFKPRAITRLKNGGILMELDSKVLKETNPDRSLLKYQTSMHQNLTTTSSQRLQKMLSLTQSYLNWITQQIIQTTRN